MAQPITVTEKGRLLRVSCYNPLRMSDDADLFQAIRKSNRRTYIATHIRHSREVTPEARLSFLALQQAGAVLINHTPLVKGVNDDPAVLSELLELLTYSGVTPYSLFVNQPTSEHDGLPLKDVYRMVEKAKARTSGVGKHVRLWLNHPLAHIEILAVAECKAYLKWADEREEERFRTIDCPDDAVWFDDLDEEETGGNTQSDPAEEPDPLDDPARLPWPRHVIMD